MKKLAGILFFVLFPLVGFSQIHFSLNAGPNYTLPKTYSGGFTRGNYKGLIGYEIFAQLSFPKYENMQLGLGFIQTNFDIDIAYSGQASGGHLDAKFQLGKIQPYFMVDLGNPNKLGAEFGFFYNYKVMEKSEGTQGSWAMLSSTNHTLSGNSDLYKRGEFGIRFHLVWNKNFGVKSKINWKVIWQINTNNTISRYEYGNAFKSYFALTAGYFFN